MNPTNYLSPSTILFVHHQIPVVTGNKIIDNWLLHHPRESRVSLSKLLVSKQVLVKNDQLIDLPQLSLTEATKMAQKILDSGQLEIKEREYKLRHYRSCFVGSELVDYLVSHHDYLTEEAIAIGQSLSRHNLIQHVLNEHEFKNEFLFYRFQLEPPELSLAQAQNLLQEILLNNAVEIKDRWHQLKCYKKCFLGSDLVSYLVKTKNIDVTEAIALGQGLMEHQLLQHVLDQHEFKNEPLFYEFLQI